MAIGKVPAAVLVLAALSTLASPPVSQVPVAGTYELLICRDGCGSRDKARAYIRGTLVLASGALSFDSASTRARRRLMQAFLFYGPPLRIGHADRLPDPNGCFVLTSVDTSTDSYAGIDRVGLLLWRLDGASRVIFELYRSPDAGYDVAVRATGDALAGVGESWGAGAAATSAPRDSVVGWRIGPPSAARCSAAAMRGSHDSA